MAFIPSTVALPSEVEDAFPGCVGVGLPAPGGGDTYFVTRNFYVPRASVYLLRIWAPGAGNTVRVGKDGGSMVDLLTPAAGALVESSVYLEQGNNRIELQTIANTNKLFGMLIYMPGDTFYRSSPAGWVYDIEASVDDADVPAVAEPTLPVFSFTPDWSESVTEQIMYMTGVNPSESAHEGERRTLRFRPRRTFEASFLRDKKQRSRMDSFFIGTGPRKFWLPLWHEQFWVPGGLAAASTTVQFPAGSMVFREFCVGDTVIVIAKDPAVYELLTVAAINYTDDVLQWVAGPTLDWAPGVRIIPCRVARIQEQVTPDAPTDEVLKGRVRFALAHSEARFLGEWQMSALSGPGGPAAKPLWNFRVNRAEDMSFTYDNYVFTNDTEIGPVEITQLVDRPLVSMKCSVALLGREESFVFRRFIDRAAGRANAFFMPTLMADIKLVGPTISGNTIDAEPAGYTDYLKQRYPVRSYLAIGHPDIETEIYEILNVERIDDVERFTLDKDVPEIAVNTVRRVQHVVPSRFDQDVFEFEHTVDDSAVIKTSVVTRSVDIAESSGGGVG